MYRRALMEDVLTVPAREPVQYPFCFAEITAVEHGQNASAPSQTIQPLNVRNLSFDHRIRHKYSRALCLRKKGSLAHLMAM